MEMYTICKLLQFSGLHVGYSHKRMGQPLSTIGQLWPIYSILGFFRSFKALIYYYLLDRPLFFRIFQNQLKFRRLTQVLILNRCSQMDFSYSQKPACDGQLNLLSKIQFTK